MTSEIFDYDLAVIGGGSGGMAAAKAAKAAGQKVVVFDYVSPTVHGTKWGFGGTCVNVGCVPKKLMHYAGLMGAMLKEDAVTFGWRDAQEPSQSTIKWETALQAVNNHVRKLNFLYRKGLAQEYINAKAVVKAPHLVQYTTVRRGETKTCTARYILVAVGGRPYVPEDVPGARECSITSDDLFWRSKPPGKTLVVGASYIALECAGFLHHMGFPVTVAVRSILLRGFDRTCAEFIGHCLEETGVRICRGSLPASMKQLSDGKIEVTFGGNRSKDTEIFDTVLYATGRRPCTREIGLEAVGVALHPETAKVINHGPHASTSVPSIFAIGDCVQGIPELTPVAIRSAEVLVRNLFVHRDLGAEKFLTRNIPTTVFTPNEYGCVGFTEEDAYNTYGRENVEVYLAQFHSLEMSAAGRMKVRAFCKEEEYGDIEFDALAMVVCLKTEKERIIGIHFVGPNAGEVLQGFALAVRCGATKADLDSVVGIHPTCAEIFCDMRVTRASGEDYLVRGGCGGGKCG